MYCQNWPVACGDVCILNENVDDKVGHIWSNPTTRIANSSSVTKTACVIDLRNREWYHRSSGVKMTGKNSEYERKKSKNQKKQTAKKNSQKTFKKNI